MSPSPDTDDYRPTKPRTRLLIVLLAVVTAGVVMVSVFAPPARLKSLAKTPPDRAACEAGQTENCVGGKVEFIAVPAASAAPR